MLEQLLHNILKIDIYNIQLLNNELIVKNVNERGKIVDSLIKVNDKIYIHIEVNTHKDKIMNLRNLVYFYHIVSTKTEHSKKYNKDELFIHIDFSYGLSNIKGEVEEYKERNKTGTLEYIDSIKIIEFNMDKITNFWYSKDEEKIKEYKYLIMLSLEKEELEKLCSKFEGDEFIMKFKKKCEKINSDEKYTSFLTPEEDEMFLRNSYIDEGIKLGEVQGEARGIKLGEARGEARGIKLGEVRGEERGIKLGEARGEVRGEKRGIELGEKRGKEQATNTLARNMLREGISIALIEKCTNLSKQQIMQLQ